MKKRKTIALPGLHDLDITPIQAIVDSAQFQRLKGIRQLGPTAHIFPGAEHTRFQHSLYAYSIARERVQRLVENGEISPRESRNICLHALLHDIGHSAYSHALEDLCREDHNQHGCKIVDRLGCEIEMCSGDVQAVKELMLRKHPFHCIVSDRPLGADKLAYLILDSRNTQESVQIRTGDLLNHVFYAEDKLAIDITIVPQVLQLHSAYLNMYLEVYYRKGSLIAQAFIKQIVHRAITSKCLRSYDLQDLTDCELNSVLMHASDAIVQALFKRFVNRDMPKTVIQIHSQEVRPLIRIAGKPIQTFGVSKPAFEMLEEINLGDIRRAELKLASYFNLQPWELLVVPPPPVDRLTPSDVTVYDDKQKLLGLQTMRPMHYAAMRETMTGSAALRICVPKEYRQRIYNMNSSPETIMGLLTGPEYQ